VDLTAAFWVALTLSIPVNQITGDLALANSWVSSSLPVIGVGLASMEKLLGENSSYVNFCNYSAWQSSPSKGPIDGCGTTALDSLQVAYYLAHNALSGTSLSGMPTQCQINSTSCQA
jgi:hypothetical protein